MKYIFILLTSFFISFPAHAVLRPKGEVPIVTPLQPPAAGIAPNYSKNIQYAQPGLEETPTAEKKELVVDQAPIRQELAKQTNKPSLWILITIILLGLGVIAFVLRNNKNPKSH